MVAIQGMTPVRDSMVWSLQTRFYQGQGPDAWKNKLVPQGSTANCYTADTYAGIVAAFLRDLQAQGNTARPIIIELGGGSGRFAWQFLNRLCHYHFSDEDTCPPFTYLLTDAATANIDNWQAKARFKPLIESGVLEFAELWVDATPIIKTANGALSPADIADRPVVFIANYLFDSIPCDLFRIRDHQVERVLMALESEEEDFLDKPITSFESVKEKFSSIPIDGAPTGHPLIDSMLQKYTAKEGDFHVQVPESSLRFLESFCDRTAPMLLLAGDLAYADPDDFHIGSPFIFDKYFAHYCNFDMIAQLFRLHGGSAQFQRQRDVNFCCGAFILPGKSHTASGDGFKWTRRVATDALKEFNPYDAHELIELIDETVAEASIRQVFAWLRFSRFDPAVAEACLPVIFEQLEQGEEKIDDRLLYEAMMEAYQAFFPDGSPVSIDCGLTQLCLAIQFNDEALQLIESALAEFGKKPSRLYVYALVLFRLERTEDARAALREALEIDPGYGPALRLYAEKFGKKKKAKGVAYQHLRVPFADPDVLPKATQIYDKAGAVLIDGFLQPHLVKELRAAFDERIDDWKATGLGKPNNVGDKRFTVPIRLKPPFNDPSVYANPVLLDLLTEAMGSRPVLNAFGGIVTYKGARMQHVHREHPMLFASDDANKALPTYAVTVLVPLLNLDETTGGTQLWEGTHRQAAAEKWEGEPAVIYTQAGSALVFDYRVYHGGMACSATNNRPMLYYTYSLPWFVDTLAFDSHAALGLSDEERANIPEEHQYLFRFAKRIPD